jgi:hypothetical protein
VKGTYHGPDGLSRHPRQLLEPEEEGDKDGFEDWIDRLHWFLHQILPLSNSNLKSSSQGTDSECGGNQCGEDYLYRYS